jgi:hypothetical protein
MQLDTPRLAALQVHQLHEAFNEEWTKTVRIKRADADKV